MSTATDKTVYLYTSLTSSTSVQIKVSVAELPNLESSIRAGAWYTNPATPNLHQNLGGVVQYQVA